MPLVARFLLTYLVHSSVLLGAAALACAALRARHLAFQEALLRAALVGGLVTSALQVGLALEPIGGRLHLPGPLAADASPELRALPTASATVAAVAPETPAPRWDVRAVLPPSLFERLTAMASDAAREARAGVASGTRIAARGWQAVLAIAWAAVALVGLARLVVAGARLRRLLHNRASIASDTLAVAAAAVAERLGIRRSVRLSAVPRLAAPLATGLLRPEVCLPARALAELDRDEQLALCAHELAHVARRDPAWILLVRGVEALAPLQPLNIWARRRLQDLGECLSDDLAVSASARPLGLARSLVDVASWAIGENTVLPVTVAGAIERRSRLGHRVERLMDPVRAPERQNRLFLPVAALVVLGSALVTPVVSGGSRAGDREPAAVSAPVPTAPHPAPEAPALAAVPLPLAAVPLPEAEPLPALAPLPPLAPALPSVKPASPAPPAPPAQAAPAAQPAPMPRPAPHAPARPEADALDALTREIEARARQHEGELAKLEAEMEALAERFAPDEAALEQLGEDMGRAGDELAQAVLDEVAGEKSERAVAAARRLAELETKLRALTSELRVPTDEIRALAEKSRTLAEKARPTDEELRELRRLSRELARAARPDSEELARIRRQAREQAHVAAQQAREAAQHAREAMRRAEQELRRAHQELRRAHEEALREREREKHELR